MGSWPISTPIQTQFLFSDERLALVFIPLAAGFVHFLQDLIRCVKADRSSAKLP
jgi:hypothetical protein